MVNWRYLSPWLLPLLLFAMEIESPVHDPTSKRKAAKNENLARAVRLDCPPFACNDTLRVSVNGDCETLLTGDMLLEGDIGDCYPDLTMEVYTPDGLLLPNPVPASQVGAVLSVKITAEGKSCWAKVILEDKLPPDLSCPANTQIGIFPYAASILTGALAPEDANFLPQAHTCWASATGAPPMETFNFDTIAFQVAADGIYTFVLLSDFQNDLWGAGAIFQSSFVPAQPCQNIIAFGASQNLMNVPGDWWLTFPFVQEQIPWLNNGDYPAIRLALELKKNETYYLVTTSLKPQDTGPYAWLVFKDPAVQAPAEILKGKPVYQLPWETDLVCEDYKRLLLPDMPCYKTDAEGNIVGISQALKKTLQITGFPHKGFVWEMQGAAVSDCAPIEICVSDLLENESASCGNILIKRTFVAKDAQHNSRHCTQTISIRKPGVNDLILPHFTAHLECDEFYPVDSSSNPHPSVTGYPFLRTAFGFIDLKNTYCNLSAVYTDKAFVQVCEKGSKFLREWTIYNWCNPSEHFTYQQTVKVGDFTPPAIACPVSEDPWDCIPTFSTGPFNCSAGVLIPAPDTIVDNCSNWVLLVDVITQTLVPQYNPQGVLIGYETQESSIATGKKAGDLVLNVPKGLHRFRYRATDDCGNEGIRDCWFEVVDLSQPLAQCDDVVHISLGNGSSTKVYAADLDENSYDGCSSVRLEVRREVKPECKAAFESATGIDVDPFFDTAKNIYYTPWAAAVDVLCCDLVQPVRTELRVWDDGNMNGIPGDTLSQFGYCQRTFADNQNTCWLMLVVEDKTKPACQSPVDVSISCIDPKAYSLQTLSLADTALMNNLFGRFTAIDNCTANIVHDTIIDARDHCGVGNITRIAYAKDLSGNVSSACSQVITITKEHHYEIGFPADVSGDCDIVLDTVIELNQLACDLLALSVTDERFSADNPDCYKVFRTFRVINWCEYDGFSSPVIINRDEDCDEIPGDEKVFVLRRPGDKNSQPAFIDRNDNELDADPAQSTKKTNCDGSTNPKGYWRRSNSLGYWQYTQIIKVHDSRPPEMFFSATPTFCSNLDDCAGEVDVPFIIFENCTPQDIDFTVIVDLYRDSVDMVVVPGTPIKGQYPKLRFEGRYPIGEHTVEIRATDGCGNTTTAKVPFKVADCKAPAPICIDGLAAALMPVEPPADVNGDGAVDQGAVTIWATDFLASDITDCTLPVRYSINKVGSPPNINQTSLVLTCSDFPGVDIEIHAWDSANNPKALQPDSTRGGPNRDFCRTYVLVQDNLSNACFGGGAIAGLILTEAAAPVENVAVKFSGSPNSTATNPQGQYQFDVLEQGKFNVVPSFDEEHLRGVSTLDIIAISQHILGTKKLDSPYKIIAADVNKSNAVSTLDIILLRKIILGIDIEFANNTSWRFVDRKYVFPNPTNPWQQPFPESIAVDFQNENISDADFVAIKIGDANLDGFANLSSNRSTSNFALWAKNPLVRAGDTYQLDVYADVGAIQGCQFTVDFDTKALEYLYLKGGIASEAHFGLSFAAQGIITLSWNDDQVFNSDERLFSLIFSAKKTGQPSDWLQINSKFTKAEAYDKTGALLPVQLRFEQENMGFQLYQNTPNPFRESSKVGFYLPERTAARLTIFAPDGRIMTTQQDNYAAGYHEMKIEQPLPEGVLYYTLETSSHTATRKMLVVN